MAVIDNLVMTEEAFATAIASFETRKTELQNAYLKISNEVRQLGTTYKGAAAEAFQSQFETLYNNLQTTEGSMDAIVSTLKQTKGIYEQYVSAVAKMTGNLDVGKPTVL